MPKKRRRKSRRNELARFKQVETEGVDFLPFMAGMITSLAIIFLIWNQIATALGTQSASGIGPTVAIDEGLLDPDDVDAVIASGDPDRLASLLLKLRQSLPGKKPTEHVRINDQCIQIADQMLELQLSPDHELLAKESKLDSLSENYGLYYMFQLGQPDVIENLRDVAKLYAQETNPRLVRNADLSLFKLNTFALTRSRLPGSVNRNADEIVGLLKQYPADEFVILTIRLTLKICLRENQKVGMPLIEDLCSRKNDINSAKAQAMIQDLSDNALLVKTSYEKLFEDRWVHGSVGQRELLSVSIYLINHREAGQVLISKVDEVAHWFEQEDRTEDANKIYDAMLLSAESYPNPDAANFARKTATAGLRRNNLVNKKIEWTGVTPDGSVIRSQEFEQRTVVVIFWSLRSAASIAELYRLHREASSWISKPIDVLAVCVDDNSTDNKLLERVQDLASELNRFKFIIRDSAGGEVSSLLGQCPSSRVPRAMLIGKDGRVVDVNVPTEELKTFAEGV